jgi:glycosyltransferase involved in cell wall biosynthesis
MDERKKKVSVLIPMYNEQEVLPALFERLNSLMDSQPNYDWEVLLVNDGSRDNTLVLAMNAHAKDARYRYIDLSRNYGKEIAMLAGFDNVTGDCVVIMDADLQEPPEVVPQMLQEWENGYDDVYGRRVKRGKEPWLRRKLTILYYHLLQKTTKIPVLENVGDFRLLDRQCIDALTQLREHHRYTKGMYCYVGFRKKEIPFVQADREAGVSKWNFFKLLSLAMEGITSYTTAPLRIATVAGAIASLFCIAYIVYIVIKTLFFGESVQGYPTMIVAIMFLGGLQLITLGIMGEYIGRIFNETKNRPTYFIREMDGKRRKS